MSFFDSISHGLGTDGSNRGLLQAFTGDTAAAADLISGAGREVAKSPLAQGAITVGGAAMGVPPWITAAVLGANRTAQDGDVGAGVLTGVGSYLGGRGVNSYLSGENALKLAQAGAGAFGLMKSGALHDAPGNAGVDDLVAHALDSDPQSLALRSAKLMDDAYYAPGGTRGALVTQAAKSQARGDAAYDQLLAMSKGRNGDLEGYRTYVNGLVSPAELQRVQGQAMADVQMQSDNAMDAARRNAYRQGVDPTRVLAQQGTAAAINTAAAKVRAARAALDGQYGQYNTGINNVANLGLKDSALRAGALQTGVGLGASGFDSWGNLAKMDSAAGTAATNAYNAATNAGSQRIAANNGAQQTANQAAQYAQSQDPWSTLSGAVLTGVGKNFGLGLSDSIGKTAASLFGFGS